MADHTTDRFCTSCGSCRVGTVDPYTGETLVEVEVIAIPDDIASERDRIVAWLLDGGAWDALGAGDELGVSGVPADDVGNILNTLAGLIEKGPREL